MKLISEFLNEYIEDNNQDIDYDIINEGLLDKIIAAWKGLKQAIKGSPAWQEYQKLEKRYEQVDKEQQQKFDDLDSKKKLVEDVVLKKEKKLKVNDKEKQESESIRKEVALETISSFERMNKANNDYKSWIDLAKECGFKNLKACQNFLTKSNDDKDNKKS